jgi:zinc metalloprotease ZmpB
VISEGRALEPQEVQPLASVPTLPLPAVPPSIQPGVHYIVRELLFSLTVPVWGALNWRAFVELQTGAVLYLRALTAGQTCCVFITDPVSATGLPLNGGSPAAALDAARTLDLPLLGLRAPVDNVQALAGDFAEVRDTDPPAVEPPTENPPYVFCYGSVTDDFAAASACYHHDAMFRMVEDFGFRIADYFDGASFPVPVDHRGFGNAVNAQAPGNTRGSGVYRFHYGLAHQDGPVGIVCDPRVCLHEFGHALLWDHVSDPNFGWCHSAGDTLAALLHDAGSRAQDRFATFPFIPLLAGRRHDRDVAAGWAWGGAQDDRQYGSEQILSTLMFRIYRVAGGDDLNIDVQRFAARYLTYLIIHAIGLLTETSTDPRTFVSALMDADELTPSFEGHPGGAWHKVIRWSFERQGLYQPAGAPRPVTQPGAPPDVDVYIDDGRRGQYEPYQTTFANTPGVWNRLASDGGTEHQPPLSNATNYLYVVRKTAVLKPLWRLEFVHIRECRELPSFGQTTGRP